MSANGSTKEDIIQEQILLAAKRFIYTHGIHKVTIDDVAKAIGKGRSSLYYYYKSKDEIFDAVIKIEINDMISAIKQETDKVNGVENKFYTFCITKLKVLREKLSFFNTLDSGMDAEAIHQFNQTIKIAHHNLIMKLEGSLLSHILNKGVEDRELKPIADKE